MIPLFSTLSLELSPSITYQHLQRRGCIDLGEAILFMVMTGNGMTFRCCDVGHDLSAVLWRRADRRSCCIYHRPLALVRTLVYVTLQSTSLKLMHWCGNWVIVASAENVLNASSGAVLYRYAGDVYCAA